MSRKLMYKGCYILLPLVVVLHIAVGMPLVHPFFHNHLDHDHASRCHCAEHLRIISCEDNHHECPICNFLATSPLHATELPKTVIANGQLGNVAHVYQSIQIKTGSKQIEPRAPPARTLI